jgi:glutathione synthase/RimK-type ligase-like ATP-grasp enzyme
MILIFGALGDSGIGHLVNRLLDRGLSFLLLDPREHGKGFKLNWEMDGERMTGQLRHGSATTPLAEVSAIYVHLWRRPNDAAQRRYPFAATQAMLQAFLDTTPIPVCNRPSCCASNFSKTYQQQIIESHGFSVPRTLVTNQPDEARAFFGVCRGRVIYKSLSSMRSVVRRISDSDLNRLELLANGPTQFQEWLPGTDVRVHVMGSRVYATAIDTEAIDYRYSNREGVPQTMRGIVLPEDLAQGCVMLTESLGMVCAGIDLRRCLDGRWYCFEANPTPAFAYYEQFTGQRIADGLIDALLDAAAACGRYSSPDKSRKTKDKGPKS